MKSEKMLMSIPFANHDELFGPEQLKLVFILAVTFIIVQPLLVPNPVHRLGKMTLECST